MMLQISQIKLPVGHEPKDLEKKIASMLHCGREAFTYEILKKSLDARKKDQLRFVYTVAVRIRGEKKPVSRPKDPRITLYEPVEYRFPQVAAGKTCGSPVIVGSGPAGLFAAWYLAEAGFCPLILERGEPVEERTRTVENFWKGAPLDPESNVQFGEGGAGTFSDGKLNTQVKDPSGRNREVLSRFVAAGAPEEILYEQKPHLGTDVLRRIVQNMRSGIQEMGGRFLFRTRMEDLELSPDSPGAVRAVITADGERIPADILILAPGHSARDTFAMLRRKGIPMVSKAFAVGVRVEHPQSWINLAQYGAETVRGLEAASYRLAHNQKDGRGVYTFCMCPGGYVVNASSETGRLCVNGMSYSGRAGENANSAVIVTVRPEDYDAWCSRKMAESGTGLFMAGEPGEDPAAGVPVRSGDPLAGLYFQRQLEEAAWRAGKGRIPVQLFEDFCHDRSSTGFGLVRPRTMGEYALSNLRGIFPAELSSCLIEGITAFGTKLKGYSHPETVLSGVESRTSSPVRILRDPVTLQSTVAGLFPCGEGAGYAGGITSAAMDGLKAAEKAAELLGERAARNR